jgi:hypothetical protein
LTIENATPFFLKSKYHDLKQETDMSYISDLLEERQTIVKWLLNALNGRLRATDDEENSAVRRIVDIEKLLKKFC